MPKRKITITAYLPGYEGQIRDDIDVDEDEYLKDPSGWQKKAKDKLIRDFGSGHKGGSGWSATTRDRIRTEAPPVTKHKIFKAPAEKARRQQMTDFKESIKSLNVAEVREARKLLLAREKEARAQERGSREVARLEAQVTALQARLAKLKGGAK